MSKNPRWKRDAKTPTQKAVANRLDELGRNPFRAALENGLPRTFIYEFLTGKKRSFRYQERDKFAAALNWSANELAAVFKDGVGNIGSDPVDRSAAEAAFTGLTRILRPDLAEERSDLVELFRNLVLTPPEPNLPVSLEDQMFLRAQLLARRFAPKIAATTESPRRGLALAGVSQGDPDN